MNRSYSVSRGFTIVELMIAMAFISFLLLAIAAAVMQIGAIYNKGVTIKSVNQVGRIVVADMRRTIGAASILNVNPSDANSAYRPQDHSGGSEPTVDYDGGRFCTGAYSYIWNIGKYITDDPAAQKNKYDGADSNKPLRFARVIDPDASYCKGAADNPVEYSKATELLSEENLAVQKFDIKRVNSSRVGGNALYQVSIFISDSDQTAIDTVDIQCKPPKQDASYEEYCAVNEFVFTALAGNGGA